MSHTASAWAWFTSNGGVKALVSLAVVVLFGAAAAAVRTLIRAVAELARELRAAVKELRELRRIADYLDTDSAGGLQALTEAIEGRGKAPARAARKRAGGTRE